ncbi:glycosyltransferase [Candidatus Woesearchaeota archaeon]|nr:glycosyltransferase [Candidatus Woesearchaeota archaeon]
MKKILSLDLSIVTITYNERENIRLFIKAVNEVFKAHSLRGEIVVVDDSSPDGTADAVRELQQHYPATTLVSRPDKMGIGSAYRDGSLKAQGEVVMFLDADLSHPPTVIPEMQRAALENKIAFGSRYLGETKFETDLPHHIGTFTLNTWVRVWLKTGLYDHTNGFIALRRETLKKIIEYAQPFRLDPFDHILYGITIAAVARKLGVSCVEIKAPYNQRVHGETKIPFWWGLKVVFGDMAYALKVRHRLR